MTLPKEIENKLRNELNTLTLESEYGVEKVVLHSLKLSKQVFNKLFTIVSSILEDQKEKIIQDYQTNVEQKHIDSAVEAERDRIVSEIENLYPSNFIYEVEYGKGIMLRGLRREIDIARMTIEESSMIDNIINLIKK